MPLPVVTFCPYLPLDREVALGPWRVAPLEKFEGSWDSPRFEELSRMLIRAHETRNPALIYHSKRGADGRPPKRYILERIQTVLNLGVLSSNPAWAPDVDGHYVATTDNAEVVSWPIDVTTAYVSTREGFIVRVLTGGHRIDGDLKIKPPDGLTTPLLGIRLDDDELYSSLWRFLGTKSDLASRVRVSLRWLSKSWLNTPSIDVGDRVAFLKTGFEALLGISSKLEASKALRRLFEGAYRSTAEWELEALLWSPSEQSDIKWRDPRWNESRRDEKVSALQHWFLAFSEERNRVIHEGAVPKAKYARNTQYDGVHFHTASRVLQEAIRTVVGDATGKQLALPPSDRGRRETYERFDKRIAASRILSSKE